MSETPVPCTQLFRTVGKGSAAIHCDHPGTIDIAHSRVAESGYEWGMSDRLCLLSLPES